MLAEIIDTREQARGTSPLGLPIGNTGDINIQIDVSITKRKLDMTKQELEARVKSLEDEIRGLKDIEEIKKLQRIYGYYLEHWLWVEVIDLFSDSHDTSVEIGDLGVYLGKEGIKRFFYREKISNTYLHVLMQVSGVVDVDPGGETAKGRWYGFGCFAFDTDNGVKPLWGNGVYENEYIREKGKWKIKKLYYSRIFMSPYEDGWVKTPVANLRRPKLTQRISDRPSTTYKPYPSGYLLPYHYKHPITGK